MEIFMKKATGFIEQEASEGMKEVIKECRDLQKKVQGLLCECLLVFGLNSKVKATGDEVLTNELAEIKSNAVSPSLIHPVLLKAAEERVMPA